jgi:UDP-N-acetylmuramoyl-tripeptide--D-alanyl-D-alanine ligase
VITGAGSDSRKVEPGQLFVAVKGEKFDGHDFVATALEQGAALALVARGWSGFSTLPPHLSVRCLVVDDVTQGFRRLAKTLRARFPFPVVAVGGSNGKTTTKELLAAALGGGDYLVTKTQKSENGFLGMALTISNRAHSLKRSPHALVLEIGIDEKGAMDDHVAIGKPDVALLTALGPEHLAGLDNWETAIAEELKLFYPGPGTRRVWQGEEPVLRDRLKDTRAGDTVVIASRDDLDAKGSLSIPGCAEADIRERGVSVMSFSTQKIGTTGGQVLLAWYPSESGAGTSALWTHTFEVPLPGDHNIRNFALAVATAAGLGRTLEEILNGLKTFQAPPMRSRIVTLNNGCVLFDDCYNASPSSMKAAFDLLGCEEWKQRPKLVVLGDMLDLGEESRKWHLELVEYLSNFHDVHLCLFGQAMYDVFQELQKDSVGAKARQRVVTHLAADENPTRFMEITTVPLREAVVLVKGSRGMDLGRVVTRVEEMCR